MDIQRKAIKEKIRNADESIKVQLVMNKRKVAATPTGQHELKTPQTILVFRKSGGDCLVSYERETLPHSPNAKSRN